MTPPPLDPRKSPWKRGDVCTLGFEKNGFVVDCSSQHFEVRWIPGGIVEQIPAGDIDNLLRVAHADSLSPDGRRTNLQFLEAVESLSHVQKALAERINTVKDENEKKELDRLARRIFAEDGCEWDKKHRAQLLTVLVEPKGLGVIFRFRERLHRLFCSSLLSRKK
jgi:hypothetical protein